MCEWECEWEWSGSGSGSGSWSEGVGVGVRVGVRPQGFLDWEGFRKAAAGAPRLGGEWGAGRGGSRS